MVYDNIREPTREWDKLRIDWYVIIYIVELTGWDFDSTRNSEWLMAPPGRRACRIEIACTARTRTGTHIKVISL